MFLSCLTPLGWLERNPTYKEQLREITTRDLQTYAFLGYPVLQAADILLYKAQAVPIGEDQLPHLELTREISRKFNFLYKKDVFVDCEAILTPTPRLLGLDGRKMSKSYGNTINLSDTPDEIMAKVKNMITDPKRLRLKDVGHPDECNVFSYYKVFMPDLTPEVRAWCEGATKGCTDCKKILAEGIIEYLRPIRAKREKVLADPGYVKEVLKKGAEKARAIATTTMEEVRSAVFR
jgi:tryptophanyl-tRNA synthetase